MFFSGKWISVISGCKAQTVGLPTCSRFFVNLVQLLKKVWHHLVTVNRFIKFSPIERISLRIFVDVHLFAGRKCTSHSVGFWIDATINNMHWVWNRLTVQIMNCCEEVLKIYCLSFGKLF